MNALLFLLIPALSFSVAMGQTGWPSKDLYSLIQDGDSKSKLIKITALVAPMEDLGGYYLDGGKKPGGCLTQLHPVDVDGLEWAGDELEISKEDLRKSVPADDGKLMKLLVSDPSVFKRNHPVYQSVNQPFIITAIHDKAIVEPTTDAANDEVLLESCGLEVKGNLLPVIYSRMPRDEPSQSQRLIGLIDLATGKIRSVGQIESVGTIAWVEDDVIVGISRFRKGASWALYSTSSKFHPLSGNVFGDPGWITFNSEFQLWLPEPTALKIFSKDDE